MRIFLGLLAASCAAVLAAGANAAVPPGASSYHWVQPGTAVAATPFARPPAWIVARAAPSAPALLTSYRWVQPGAAIVVTPFAQPPVSVPVR